MTNFKNKKDVSRQLEADYADRGLKFTVDIIGAVPVQAWGHIDGLRFYFRFRGNVAQLRVGPYVHEFEKLYAQRVNEDIAKRNEEYEKQDRSDRELLRSLQREEQVVREDAVDFIPHHVAKYSFLEGSDPEDIYNGSLSPEEAYETFSKLIDTLEDVPEKEQLSEHERIWIYKGREAANVYREKEYKIFEAKWLAEQAAKENTAE